MSDEAYHEETETLSCSQLKVFIKSPRDYYEQFVTKMMPRKKASREMVLGTICHAMLLERKSIYDIARRYSSSCLNVNGGLIGPKAREFEESIHPILAVKDDVWNQCIEILKAVHGSKLSDVICSNAKFEQRLDGMIEGVDCRCKPDIHAIVDGFPVIWDLKTTERVYPDDWWRTAKRMGYAIQDAFYSLVAEQAYKSSPAMFRFWAIETIEPYRVQPYWYDNNSREIARQFVIDKIIDFKRRRDDHDWSDNWESQGTIGPWDLGAGSDEAMVEWSEQ